MAADIGSDVDLSRLAEEIPDAGDLMDAEDDAPIIRLINAILSEAVREKASDIHIETFEDKLSVRYRIDGVLSEVLSPKRALGPLLVSRLKVMARLDIAEKRVPQDGRISVRIAGHAWIFACRPALGLRRARGAAPARQAVRAAAAGPAGDARDRLRGLPPGAAQSPRDHPGDRSHGLRQDHDAVRGPVGDQRDGAQHHDHRRSGGVHAARRRADPGQPKVDMTFARGLRAILRQDPDVVMVGEIRDLETAEIAVQASLTGHLVLSTLHTNTAIGAVTRLQDMGMEPFLLSSSLMAVMAQRLVRLLCRDCREPFEPSEQERALLDLAASERAPRCTARSAARAAIGSGYRGRTGIYELIEVDERCAR
jgi:general secretion pathway protein E